MAGERDTAVARRPGGVVVHVVVADETHLKSNPNPNPNNVSM